MMWDVYSMGKTPSLVSRVRHQASHKSDKGSLRLLFTSMICTLMCGDGCCWPTPAKQYPMQIVRNLRAWFRPCNAGDHWPNERDEDVAEMKVC